jgi:MFS family permease
MKPWEAASMNRGKTIGEHGQVVRGPMIPGRMVVYALLFAMTAINYLDRVNLSLAAGTIARELHLSPVTLGWLFSGFLWSYIVFLIPSGFLADRFGYRSLLAIAVGVWSVATASTAAGFSVTALLLSRIGVGVGEGGAWPLGTRAVRAWAPRSEYGLAISAISLGQSFGVGFGALFIGWLITMVGWRASFVIGGVVGLVWAVVWLWVVRDPAKARWLGEEERGFILKARDETPAEALPGGYAALFASPAMWALTLGQGCLVYAYYMLLTWLPNYLQTVRGIAIFRSGVDTAIIYGTAVVGSILLAHLTDRIFSIAALKRGARRTAVVLSFIPAMLMATTPWLGSTAAVIAVLAVSVTFLANAISLNAVLCNDLVRRPGDAGKAIALFTAGSNVIGITAPIVTGYLVGASKAFNAAFLVTGGILVIGAVILICFARGGIGRAEAA